MAVTAQSSTQHGNPVAVPPVMNKVSDDGGRVRVAAFNFTQAGAGDANSIANLLRMPQGRIRLLRLVLKNSALGAGRTMSVGLSAYKNAAGATVALSANKLLAATDLSSAAVTVADLPNEIVDSRGGFAITAKCLGDTLADGVTLDGYVLYVND